MWCQVQATPAVPGQGCPLVRTKHAMCFTADGHIYLYGGRSMANKPLRDLWRFDTAQDQWEEVLPRVETPHSRHSTLAANSSSASSSSSTSSSAESSPLSPENKYEPPPALQEHTIVAAKSKLYLFGGQVGYSSDETPLWIFDLVSARWSKFSGNKCSSRSSNATAQPMGRRGHTAVLFRNVMSIYGGYQDFKGSSPELWTFHLDRQEWTRESDHFQKCPSPPGRHNHSAVVFKDSMFIYGGMTDLQLRSDFWSWNYKTKKWSRIKTSRNPGELCCHSAIVVAESMFIYGGERGEGQAIAELWRYRFESTTWQQVTVQGIVPGCRTRHAAVAIPFLNVFDTVAQGFDWCENKETSFINGDAHSTSTSPNQKDEQTQVEFDCYELQPKKSISLCFEHESGQNRSLMSPAETEPKKKIIKSNSFRIRSRSPVVMASLCRHSDTLSDEEVLTEETAPTDGSENNQNALNECSVPATTQETTVVRMRPRSRRPLLQRQRPYSDFYGAPPTKLAEELELNELTEKQLKRRSVQESMSYYSLCFPTPPARVAKLKEMPPESGDPKQESSETLTNQQTEVRMRDNSSLKRRVRKAALELPELNSLAFVQPSAADNSATSMAFTNPAYYSLSLDISPDFEKELPPPPSAMSTPSQEEEEENSSANDYSFGSEDIQHHAHSNRNARCIDLDLIEDYFEPEEMLEIVTTESMDDPDGISPTMKLKTIAKTPAHKSSDTTHSHYHAEPRTHRAPSVSHSSSGYQSLILADGIATTASFDLTSNPSLSNSSSFADHQEHSSTASSNGDNLNIARSITLNLRRGSGSNPRGELIELQTFRPPLEAREHPKPQQCMRSRSLDRAHPSEGKHRATKPHWQPNITEVIREVIVPRSPALKSPHSAESYNCNGDHVNAKKKPLVSALVGRGRSHKAHNGVNQNWQLCMYVFGGRDGTTSGSALLNKQPITIWKLYI